MIIKSTRSVVLNKISLNFLKNWYTYPVATHAACKQKTNLML